MKETNGGMEDFGFAQQCPQVKAADIDALICYIESVFFLLRAILWQQDKKHTRQTAAQAAVLAGFDCG